jgi:hypothetical protein
VTTRHFTVAEARALLPELDGVFQELAELRTELERHTDRVKILDALWGTAVRETGNPDRDEFLTERSAARTVIRKMDRLVKERILALGIRFPQGGLEHGLVDFPTRLEGRTVYLCWRWGEEEIANWHEVDGGYAGRRPLTDDLAGEMTGDSSTE